jgi:hypothetical protein
MLTTDQIKQYHDTGWLWLRDVIPEEYLHTARKVGQELATKVYARQGQLSPHGPRRFWKGVGCASAFDKRLTPLYRSKLMYDLSNSLLEQSYLYNDQIVYKMPFHPEFSFGPHCDNMFGPNTDHAIHTINFSWVLDDFTTDNGPLEIYDQGEYKTLLAKAGDIIAIRGDTFHRSENNNSGIARGLYACVYTEQPIQFENFYSEKFTHHSS